MALILLAALPLAAQEPCAIDFPHDSNPTAITDSEVCNFHQVDADLYRGGRPREGAYPELQKLGIRTILDLEGSDSAQVEKSLVEQLNKNLKPEDQIDFISFPISQEQIETTGLSSSEVKELFRLIAGARKPIFTHCYYGRDRTGAVVALYRMVYDKMTFQQAIDEAMHYRFSDADSGLMRTVRHYRKPSRLEALISTQSSKADRK